MSTGTLYIVGTPIGNLGDISPRALDTLEKADFIAAEDTRVTLKLLNHFEIRTPMICYFEHNTRSRGEIIIERLLAGENCALVTDAGMPAISDPGEDLVRLAHESGIKVSAVPGPTAFATALAMSGMDSSRFTFEGFLPVNKNVRRERLESLKLEERTMIFYEAPHKLSRTLLDFTDCFGPERKICIVREITKIFEEIIHSTIGEAAERFPNNDLKGELVLLLEGAEKRKIVFTLEEAVELAERHIEEGLSASLAAKQAAKESGIKKGDIYKVLMEGKE